MRAITQKTLALADTTIMQLTSGLDSIRQRANLIQSMLLKADVPLSCRALGSFPAMEIMYSLITAMDSLRSMLTFLNMTQP